MHLYNVTLQKNTAITVAVYGSFSAPKMQEIAVGRGKYLDLIRPDENGHLVTICSMEVFGIVRSLAAFRFAIAQPSFAPWWPPFLSRPRDLCLFPMKLGRYPS